MQKGLAKPLAVVAQLRLGDGEVLAYTIGLGAVGAGQTFQRVHDSPRSLVIA